MPTLLVAADLRNPTLHERLGVPQSPGLAEVLSALERSGGDDAADVIREAVHAPENDTSRRLRVLPSGNPSRHPAALLSGDAVGVLFDALARSRYRFVIVEGAALSGPVDGQLLAHRADALLVVCRLDRTSPGEAVELAAVLARLDAPALGAVVIGGAQRELLARRRGATARGRPHADGVAVRPHRAGPDQGGHHPQVAPVQRVDEEAVDEQAEPRAEQCR